MPADSPFLQGPPVPYAALVLALAAPAMAGPREDARDRRKATQLGGARAALIDNGETKENLEQVVVNHLGNPDQGQVLRAGPACGSRSATPPSAGTTTP
jgi:hypothetical protein